MVCFPITLHYDSEVNVYVSYCPLLKIYSQAKTRNSAWSACCKAVESVTKICNANGILLNLLIERNVINVN